MIYFEDEDVLPSDMEREYILMLLVSAAYIYYPEDFELTEWFLLPEAAEGIACDLIRRGWVEYQDGGYRATPMGEKQLYTVH